MEGARFFRPLSQRQFSDGDLAVVFCPNGTSGYIKPDGRFEVDKVYWSLDTVNRGLATGHWEEIIGKSIGAWFSNTDSPETPCIAPEGAW